MSFAVASSGSEVQDTISQTWWPTVSVSMARNIVRMNGTVTDERLREALQNAVYSVNDELHAWSQEMRLADPDAMPEGRLTDLYLRAVYFYAKAELVERYRDFDTTGAGDRRADDQEDIPDFARRNMRWAISDLLGKSRSTIEAL